MQRSLWLSLALLAACQAGGPVAPGDGPLHQALVVGSAESPDPVLQRVRELERAGRVQDVVVLESFPVQIRLRARRQVIDELQRMPRRSGSE